MKNAVVGVDVEELMGLVVDVVKQLVCRILLHKHNLLEHGLVLHLVVVAKEY